MHVTGGAAAAPEAGDPQQHSGGTRVWPARGPSVPPWGLLRGSHLSTRRPKARIPSAS